MDLDFTAEETAFRHEVRAFVREKLPAHIRHKVINGITLTRDDHVLWQRTLHERGWGGPSWPKQFGGPGWSPTELYIFEEECAVGGAPRLISFGLRMLAPVLMAFGTQQQQERYLPRIMAAEDFWCQGYSEPGAGSDLASLKTRAVNMGSHYLVTGQKTWTTMADWADMMFCLVRTDAQAKPQRGISFLLIDLKQPGVTIRPFRFMDGSYECNDVWFENVKVPIENRIGEENQGWTYAKFLLGHERTNIAGIGISKRELARLKRVAAAQRKNGRPLSEDPLFAAKVAEVEIELMALEITNLRVLSADTHNENRGDKAIGPEASILKIKGTEIQQRIAELLMQAAGPYAQPYSHAFLFEDSAEEPASGSQCASLAAGYCNTRKLSIYGGSNEIQRNIIAQMMGL